MRKEDFFEVLGELDDDIVEEAGSDRKENDIHTPLLVRRLHFRHRERSSYASGNRIKDTGTDTETIKNIFNGKGL